MKKLRNKAVIARNFAVYRQHAWLASTSNTNFPLDSSSNFVVSVASYPKRIHLVPAVFESLARQKIRAKRAYLVLSEEDYPDKHLPAEINRLIDRGVEIVWTRNNPYAVKKLMPVWQRDPDCAVCTFDDDTIYRPQVTEGLFNAAAGRENLIVGYWGKALYQRGGKLGMWFREPVSFKRELIDDRVYLMGGGGVWYSPSTLDPRVTDVEAVQKIVPGRGSDIWFWAAAHAANAKHCWIKPQTQKSLWIPIPQSANTKPRETPGGDVLEERFQKAINFFGVRQKLQRCLPDRSDAAA